MRSRNRVTAEYIAEESTLKLEQPLEGVEDHARVTVVIDSHGGTDETNVGMSHVSREAGESLEAMIEEVFGPITR